jgi:Na+/melibiose symporter-like transporter
MSEAPQRLGWGQKIGYGSGDFAFNLYWQGISLYLFYFYTDVMGLPNAMAGDYLRHWLVLGCRNRPDYGLSR